MLLNICICYSVRVNGADACVFMLTYFMLDTRPGGSRQYFRLMSLPRQTSCCSCGENWHRIKWRHVYGKWLGYRVLWNSRNGSKRELPDFESYLGTDCGIDLSMIRLLKGSALKSDIRIAGFMAVHN
jgi:hypothetical protein